MKPIRAIVGLCCLTVISFAATTTVAEDDTPPAAEAEQTAPGEGQSTHPGTAVPRPAAEPEFATSLTQTMQGEGGLSIQTMCTNCNNADLTMGGLGNEHISMSCDGLPVPPGLAQIYLLAVMPPTVIDKVAVERGASSARLTGGSVGGQIDIERRPPADGFDVYASADAGGYGWRGARADVSGGTERIGGAFAASWATSDVIDANGDGNPDLPAFDRATAETRGAFEMGRRHELTLGASTYTEDQQDGPAAFCWNCPTDEGSVYNLEDVKLERDQAEAGYELRLDGGSRMTLGLMWARRGSDIEETLNGPETEAVPTYFIDETHRYGGLSWTQPFGDRITLELGANATEREYSVIDTRYNAFLGSLTPEQLLTESNDERLTESGAWGQADFVLGSRLELTVGLRYVEYGYTEDVNYATEVVRKRWEALPLPEGSRTLPRAALTWKPTDAVELRASAGSGYRQPSPTYEEVCCGRLYRGNRGILMEESWAYGLELVYQPAPKFQLQLAGSRTDFDNLILQMVTTSTVWWPTYQNVNIPEARYTSADLQFTYDASRNVALRGSYGVLEADNLTEDGAIPTIISFFNQPQEAVFHTDTVPYIPDSTGMVGLVLRAPRWRLTANIDAQYTGTMLIQHWESGIGNADSVLGFFPAESYWGLNLRVNHTLRNGLGFYVGVDNATDYVQTDLGLPFTDYNWGPLRGRYVYGGISYRLSDRK